MNKENTVVTVWQLEKGGPRGDNVIIVEYVGAYSRDNPIRRKSISLLNMEKEEDCLK